MSLISVVINNYNTNELLKSCIENLISTKLDLKIIIADSGSTDGSVEMVEENFLDLKNIVLIKRENTGISNGYNLALRHVNSKYILFLGTDAFPTRDTLLGIVDYFENPDNQKVGMATTKLVTREGSLDMDAHRGDPTPWNAFTHFSMLEKLFPKSKLFSQYFLGYENLQTPHEIGACISHFMFVRKSVQDQVGLWDEDFFVFGEDIDFCFRVRMLGYQLMYLPQWETLHYKGAGIGRKSSKDLKNKSQISSDVKRILSKERTRAMRLYYTKHQKNKYPPFTNFLVYTFINILELIRKIQTSFLFLFK